MNTPERPTSEPDPDETTTTTNPDEGDDVPGGDILPEGRPAEPDEGGLP